MKSSNQLQKMLSSELCDSLDTIEKNIGLDCYNELLGDTSFLLAGILENELKNNPEWSSLKWLDDSLIHKINIERKKVQLWGVMIWGKDGTTKQWTDPFFCEFYINCKQQEIQKLIVLFGDEKIEAITYQQFAENRTYWDKNYYSNEQWDPSEREWKFIISAKNSTKVK